MYSYKAIKLGDEQIKAKIMKSNFVYGGTRSIVVNKNVFPPKDTIKKLSK